jgi:FkbM family methyltransferase
MGRSFDLVNKSQKAREKDYLSHNYRDILSLLGSEPIVFLDIGAGEQAEPVVEKYDEYFEKIFVEPRASELSKLRKKGGSVIGKAISDKLGVHKLYRTNADQLSSLLQPKGEFASLYASTELKNFELVDITEIETTTIEQALSELSVSKLDYLKVDTQGTELGVLKTLGQYKPLFVKSEVFFVPIYRDGNLIWDIGKFLFDHGYVMSDLAYRSNHVLRETDYYNAPVGRLPTGGRVWFMPNWKCKKGRNLIYERDLEYAKLMIMFGMKDVLEHVLSELMTPNRDKILAVL